MDITTTALTVVLAAVFFYVLYLVVRAAVRDGIRAAREREPAGESASHHD